MFKVINYYIEIGIIFYQINVIKTNYTQIHKFMLELLLN